MASNIEIIKDVFRETTLFNGAIVSHPLIEREVKIVTKASFVRMSDLYELHLAIAEKGGKVKDIEVSLLPATDNRLSYEKTSLHQESRTLQAVGEFRS